MTDRINAGADDTWYSMCLPILEAVREVEGTDESHFLRIASLADRTRLAPTDVAVEVERLIDAGYLSATSRGPLRRGGIESIESWHVEDARLAPNGARAVRMWPARGSYEALLAILERQLATAPDEDTRSKLRKLRDRFVALGGDVGTNLLASVLFELSRGGF